jgi:hypothetical protein
MQLCKVRRHAPTALIVKDLSSEDLLGALFMHFCCCAACRKLNYFTYCAKRGSEQTAGGSSPHERRPTACACHIWLDMIRLRPIRVVQSFQALCLQILHDVAVEPPPGTHFSPPYPILLSSANRRGLASEPTPPTPSKVTEFKVAVRSSLLSW